MPVRQLYPSALKAAACGSVRQRVLALWTEASSVSFASLLFAAKATISNRSGKRPQISKTAPPTLPVAPMTATLIFGKLLTVSAYQFKYYESQGPVDKDAVEPVQKSAVSGDQ